jgi:hypothetical protein
MENNREVGFHILNLKILFMTMFNMNMFFDFVIIIFNNRMLKINKSKIHENTCKDHNLQSKWNVKIS